MKIEEAMDILPPGDREDLGKAVDGLASLRKQLSAMRSEYARRSSEHLRLCNERNQCQSKWGEPGISDLDRDTTHALFSKLTVEINAIRTAMAKALADMSDLEAEGSFEKEITRLVTKAAEIKGVR